MHLKAQTLVSGLPSAKAQGAHGDCRLCHASHWFRNASKAVPGQAMKSTRFSEMDANCLACHQGPANPPVDLGASKLPQWIGQGSSHIDGPFLNAARSYSRAVAVAPNQKTLLKPQCTACHDPHAKDRPAYLRSQGFDAYGRPLKERATTVAQLCFACHAGPDSIRSLGTQRDLGALFRPEAVSAHRPGVGAQKRQDLPSLRSGLFRGLLDCTSCHDNSNSTGPRGPHGSSYPHLLKALYGRESEVAAVGSHGDDLCYTCHDRASILGNQSFPWHAQHIGGFTAAALRTVPTILRPAPQAIPTPRGWSPWADFAAGSAAGVGKPTACATCHDSHGSLRYPALISFDETVVSRASVGGVDFQRTGWGHGSCTLSCHGHDHVQTQY